MRFVLTLKLDCKPPIKFVMLMFGSSSVYKRCILLTLVLLCVGSVELGLLSWWPDLNELWAMEHRLGLILCGDLESSPKIFFDHFVT